MKLVRQIDLMSWIKDKTDIPPKKLTERLTDNQLSRLLTLMDKLKRIGCVYDPKEVIHEFLSDNDIDLEAPDKSPSGQRIDMEMLSNLHPALEDGSIEVFLDHILLGHGFKNTRSNRRLLTKHFKDLGYKLSKKPLHTSELSDVVRLKSSYEPTLPPHLDVYNAPTTRNQEVRKWLYLGSEIKREGSVYARPEVNKRWEAHVVKRVHDLFELSELPYLYKHPVQRGLFEDVPEVQMIFQLAIRDVFKPAKLTEWIKMAISYEVPLFESAENHHRQVLLETCTESVRGSLNQTEINGKPLAYDPKFIMGELAVLVIAYVEEALKQYKGMRCPTS